MSLRNLLLVRGVFNLLFGLVLWVWLQQGTPSGLQRGGFYALVDGLLALGVAAALLRSRGRWLFVLALVDALVRLGFGAMLVANPEMPRMVLGSALFFTAVILVCIALGLGGMLYALLARPAQVDASQPRAMMWPALTISFFTLLLGVGLAFGFLQQERQILLACYAVALGATLCFAALRVAARLSAATAP